MFIKLEVYSRNGVLKSGEERLFDIDEISNPITESSGKCTIVMREDRDSITGSRAPYTNTYVVNHTLDEIISLSNYQIISVSVLSIDDREKIETMGFVSTHITGVITETSTGCIFFYKELNRYDLTKVSCDEDLDSFQTEIAAALGDYIPVTGTISGHEVSGNILVDSGVRIRSTASANNYIEWTDSAITIKTIANTNVIANGSFIVTASTNAELTAGSVVALAAGTDVTIDAGDDVIITASSVAINNTSPNFALDVTGDIRIEESGKLYFGGTGSSDNDTNLYRSAANTLKTDDNFVVGGTLTLQDSLTLTKVNTAGGSANSLTLTGTLGVMNGSDTFRGMYINYTNANHTGASNNVYAIDIANITGDAEANEVALNIGTGWDYAMVIGGDTNLYRSAADTLKTDDNLIVALSSTARNIVVSGGNSYNPESSSSSISVNGSALSDMNGTGVYSGLQVTINTGSQPSGGTIYGVKIDSITSTTCGETAIDIGSGWDYGINLSDGNTAALRLSGTSGTAVSGILFGADTNLYRSAANVLKTDDGLIVAGALTVQSVNAAGGSADALTLSGTLGIMNGSDTFRGLYLNYTNSNHTGASNVFNAIDIAAITGDAQCSEVAINIGTGWDIGLKIGGATVSSLISTVASGATNATYSIYVSNNGNTSAFFYVADDGSFGLGLGAVGANSTSVAIGNVASATQTSSIAMGTNSTASASYATAIGYLSVASSQSSVALGYGATVSTNVNGVAIGVSSSCNKISGIALADGASVTGDYGIALGYQSISSATTGYSIAAGYRATASGDYSIAIGVSPTTASGEDSIAIGDNALASANRAIAFGRAVSATAANAYVIGAGVDGSSKLINNQTLSLIVGFNSANPTVLLNKNGNLVVRSDSAITSGTHYEAAATNAVTVHNGTAPVANIVDAFAMYSSDAAAGNACPTFRTENGTVIKLFKSSAYTPSNVSADRSYDANSTSVDELADVLGTLIADLQLTGLIG